MKTGSTVFKIASTVPLLSGCLYLIGVSANRNIEYAITTSMVPSLILIFTAGISFIVIVTAAIKRNKRILSHCCILICSITPLALIFPWVISPGHLGIGFGGYGFFIDWLTKYPNFWKINMEVLGGIICVIGCSLLPGLFSCVYLQKKFKNMLMVLAVLETLFYLPVLIKLDFLFFFGVLTISPLGYGLSLFGPVMRLFSFIIMSAMAIRRMTNNNQIQI